MNILQDQLQNVIYQMMENPESEELNEKIRALLVAVPITEPLIMPTAQLRSATALFTAFIGVGNNPEDVKLVRLAAVHWINALLTPAPVTPPAFSERERLPASVWETAEFKRPRTPQIGDLVLRPVCGVMGAMKVMSPEFGVADSGDRIVRAVWSVPGLTWTVQEKKGFVLFCKQDIPKEYTHFEVILSGPKFGVCKPVCGDQSWLLAQWKRR